MYLCKEDVIWAINMIVIAAWHDNGIPSLILIYVYLCFLTNEDSRATFFPN